jgi:hypothetical protein
MRRLGAHSLTKKLMKTWRICILEYRMISLPDHNIEYELAEPEAAMPKQTTLLQKHTTNT